MTTVTHEHRGGSVGGEGQNDAECACGVAFRGFDTHTDAMAVLDEHIADGNREPDGWAVLAAELTNIATDLAALAGSGLPVPSYFNLNVQPGDHNDGASVARVTDAMAQVLLDRDGKVRLMHDGTYHYDAEKSRGPVGIHLYNSVPIEWVERQKAAAERDELLARLATAEADAAKLRAALANSAAGNVKDLGDFTQYARETDAEQTGQPVPAHVEGHPEVGHGPNRVGHPFAAADQQLQDERSARNLDRYRVNVDAEAPAREHWESVRAATAAAKTSPAGMHSRGAVAEAMPILHQQAIEGDRERFAPDGA